MKLVVSLVGIAALVTPMLVGGQPASAAPPGDSPPRDPTARAEWYSVRAEAAFEAGKFSEAIKLYLDAYESSPSGSILYNVAFIYDKRLKDAELAIDYYTRAADAPDADAALADKARARAKLLRAELDKPPDKKPPDKKPPDKKPPDKKPPGPDPVDPDDGGGFPLGPVVTMGVGAIVLGTGIVFGISADGTHADFEAAETSADKRDLQSTGRTQALVADIGMAVGGAALVGGVLWLLLADDETSEGEAEVVPLGLRWRVAPAWAPGQAGVSLGGSF